MARALHVGIASSRRFVYVRWQLRHPVSRWLASTSCIATAPRYQRRVPNAWGLSYHVRGACRAKDRRGRGAGPTLADRLTLGCAAQTDWGDTNVADDDKGWQDMNPDEQALVIRQISGAVNGLQFRVQDLEDAVKALQERLPVELKP